MSVNEDVATTVKVTLDTSSLDDLIANNNIPELSPVLDKIKQNIENGADSGSQELADTLLDYDKLFFDNWNHPYATGYSAQLWTIDSTGDKTFLVDNKAVSGNGYPYLDALETGNSKISAKPFAIHARELLKNNAETILRRNMKL